MKYTFLFLFTLASCTGGEESAVKDFLAKSMNLSESNLEISSVELGEKKIATPEQKQNLALLGLKDATTFPVSVTFKAKEDCVAIAEAIKNDVIFNEKKVSCRSVKSGSKPDLKYVKAYNFGAFGRQIAVFEEGKLIKAGETFTANGEWAHFTTFKDEKKSGTIFQALK